MRSHFVTLVVIRVDLLVISAAVVSDVKRHGDWTSVWIFTIFQNFCVHGQHPVSHGIVKGEENQLGNVVATESQWRSGVHANAVGQFAHRALKKLNVIYRENQRHIY